MRAEQEAFYRATGEEDDDLDDEAALEQMMQMENEEWDANDYAEALEAEAVAMRAVRFS